MATSPQPGIYVRGNSVRNAQTPGAAVQAVWDGYVRQDEVSVDTVDYRDLQETTKGLGIPANQSKDALVEAIANLEAEGGATVSGDSDGVEVSSDLGSPGSGEGVGADAPVS